MNQPSLELVGARGLALGLELSCTASSPKQGQSITWRQQVFCRLRIASGKLHLIQPFFILKVPLFWCCWYCSLSPPGFLKYVLCGHGDKRKSHCKPKIKMPADYFLQFLSDCENVFCPEHDLSSTIVSFAFEIPVFFNSMCYAKKMSHLKKEK